MLPSTVLFLIAITSVYTLIYLNSRFFTIQRFYKNKSKNFRVIKLDKDSENVEVLVKQIIEKFNLKVRKIDVSKEQYFLVEKVSFFSWGSYILIEKVDDTLFVYIKKKFFAELDLWNRFNNKLDEICSQIILINHKTI